MRDLSLAIQTSSKGLVKPRIQMIGSRVGWGSFTNPVSLSVVPVDALQAKQAAGQPRVLSSCTGVLTSIDDQIYIVTARHGIIDQEKDFRSDSISVRIHTSLEDPSASKRILIPLTSNSKQRWLEHKGGKDVDLAVIPTEDYLPRELVRRTILPWTVSESNEGINVLPGREVLTTGFSPPFCDGELNLPILVKGSLVTTPTLPLHGLPIFLIDATLPPGTSGAPVFTWGSSPGQEATAPNVTYDLLGIHTGAARFEGYGFDLAWNAGLLGDIIPGASNLSFTPPQADSRPNGDDSHTEPEEHSCACPAHALLAIDRERYQFAVSIMIVGVLILRHPLRTRQGYESLSGWRDKQLYHMIDCLENAKVVSWGPSAHNPKDTAYYIPDENRARVESWARTLTEIHQLERDGK